MQIYVEGKEDLSFLSAYIEYLGYPVADFNLKEIKGKDNLAGVKNDIEEHLHTGSKVLIIFDANSNYQQTLSGIKNILDRSDDNIFLFPNNRDNGNIEDLLLKIIKSHHEGIFECFEAYKRCLGDKSRQYKTPDKKAKIFAYKEALHLDKSKKPFSPQYWDFENGALQALKDFLANNRN